MYCQREVGRTTRKGGENHKVSGSKFQRIEIQHNKIMDSGLMMLNNYKMSDRMMMVMAQMKMHLRNIPILGYVMASLGYPMV